MNVCDCMSVYNVCLNECSENYLDIFDNSNNSFDNFDNYFNNEFDVMVTDLNFENNENISLTVNRNNVIIGNKLDKRPFDCVYLNEILFECLFDTGAKISVISFKVFKEINGVLESIEKSLKISCANGSALKIFGHCFINLRYKGKSIRNRFFVALDIIPEIIIGIDILEKLNIGLVNMNSLISGQNMKHRDFSRYYNVLGFSVVK